MPTILLDSFILFAILSLLILALYYLAAGRISDPLPFGATQLFALAALFIFCLLCQTGNAFDIESLLDALQRLFTSLAWQAFGLLLTGLIFIPLVIQSIRKGLAKQSWKDFLAIGAFFALILFLYLPFGFDSVGHWEEWIFKAYLENRYPGLSLELASRFWIVVPNMLASLISPGSYVGDHLVNFLMFWGRLALFYGILRKLKMDPLFAFLTTMLFMVYPVNTGLMSLRHFLMNARVLSLLAAVFFCLEYVERPSRLRLAGVWLATLLHIGSYEAGLAIIAVIPLLWWWRSPRRAWRNINLTIIWYLCPAAKIILILLSHLYSRGFYGSNYVSSALEPQQFALDSITYYAGIIERVYRQTFWYGWRETLFAFGQSEWIVPALGALAFTGAIAAYLARGASETLSTSRRQIAAGMLSGMLFILPSIGVLMWLQKYNTDLRRMYIYAPAGAAIAMFGAILLIASFFKASHLRKAFVICACLAAMLPALARLYAQHDFYVSNANNKAWILLQAVEQAPAIDAEANVVLLTKMLGTELRENGVSEFRTNMPNGAFRVLYEDKAPRLTFLCILDKRCFVNEQDLPGFRLGVDTDFSNLVLFFIHDDLSVELLRELPPELGGSSNDSYNPDRLIDAAAPIPPRALTMLAAARRG